MSSRRAPAGWSSPAGAYLIPNAFGCPGAHKRGKLIRGIAGLRYTDSKIREPIHEFDPAWVTHVVPMRALRKLMA
jgi:hypothetical protein